MGSVVISLGVCFGLWFEYTGLLFRCIGSVIAVIEGVKVAT